MTGRIEMGRTNLENVPYRYMTLLDREKSCEVFLAKVDVRQLL